MSDSKVGKDFKTFRRTTPWSVGQEGIDRYNTKNLKDAYKVVKGIPPSSTGSIFIVEIYGS